MNALRWETVLFRDIAEFKNGSNFRYSDMGFQIKMLGVGDFQTRVVLEDDSSLKGVFLPTNPPSDELLKRGDLVFVRSNGSKELVGRCLHIKFEPETLIYSGFCIRARLKSTITIPSYVSLLIQNGLLRKRLSAEGRGTNISNLNQEMLKTLPILLPPLPEQKAIADLLSTWDEAIEKTERLIEVKETRFRWLLRELISENQNSGSDTKWRNIKLCSILVESRIQDYKNDPKKRISVRLHLKGVEAREYRATESDTTAYFIRRAGQLVYGKQNIFRGALGIVPPDLDGYSSTQDIPAFDISDAVDKNWLLFLFSYSNFYKKLELYSSGSGSKRFHPKELFKIRISIPTLNEQRQISATLGALQQEITLLKQLAEKYKTQKRGLMQKLLTGEWRIKPEIVNQYAEAKP